MRFAFIMLSRQFVFALFIFVIFLTIPFTYGRTVTEELHLEEVSSFIIVSDIHYDPFYDPGVTPAKFCRSLPQVLDHSHTCFADKSQKFSEVQNSAFGQYGCDTPASLLQSMAFAVKTIQQNLGSEFLMLAGDAVGHCVHEQDHVLQSIETVAQTLSSQLPPDFKVLTAVGNNDMHPHSSMPPRPNKHLEYLADIWKPWIQNENGSIPETFLKGGYYSFSPIQGLRVLVINSVFYMKDWKSSNKSEPKDVPLSKSEKKDPAGQFAWMKEQLQQSQKNFESVYILGHVAPGASRSLKKEMNTKYQEKLLSIFKKYANIIKGSFFGHNHRSVFSMQLEETKHKGFVNLNTIWKENSVTPQDNSNPSFSVVYFNRRTFEVVDKVSYYFDLQDLMMNSKHGTYPVWYREYSYASDLLKGEIITDEGLLRVWLQSKEHPEVLSPMIDHWTGHSSAPLAVPVTEEQLRCTMRLQSTKEMKECLQSADEKNWFLWIKRLAVRYLFGKNSWIVQYLSQIPSHLF